MHVSMQCLQFNQNKTNTPAAVYTSKHIRTYLYVYFRRNGVSYVRTHGLGLLRFACT